MAAKTAPAVEPLAVTIADAERVLSTSRSEIYRLLARGELRAVKSGARTLVLMESIKAHHAALPPATFRPRPEPAVRDSSVSGRRGRDA